MHSCRFLVKIKRFEERCDQTLRCLARLGPLVFNCARKLVASQSTLRAALQQRISSVFKMFTPTFWSVYERYC
jgi:hypothetical protein